VERVRVLIAHESRLARELVRAIVSGHADFEVVGEVQDEREISSAIEQNEADCLIIERSETSERPEICDVLFRRWPHMKILAVASGSEDSALYWVSREICAARVETSEEGVLNALRSGKVGPAKSLSSGGKTYDQ